MCLMKITLLKDIGNVGVITSWKNLISDYVEFDVGEDGTLFIGAKSFKVEGSVKIIEYEIKPGPNKVMFVDKPGNSYSCGTINRNGRFVNVTNNLDKVVAELALGHVAQCEKIKQLENELSNLKKQYGISII